MKALILTLALVALLPNVGQARNVSAEDYSTDMYVDKLKSQPPEWHRQIDPAAFADPPSAPTVVVVDGDTLKLNGTTYRLWGIDAPEMSQACSNGWPAGRVAAAKLKELLAGRVVGCEAKTTDRYGRTVALCKADGRDVSADMVSAGMAWAFVRYSRDYVGLEAAAKASGIGIHFGDCLAPWEWRSR